MRSTLPAPLYSVTEPSAATLDTTRFGVVAPSGTFRFDVFGPPAYPVGYTETYVACVTFVAVTFSTTAVLPTGASPLPSGPVTCSFTVSPEPSFACGAPT